jgi:NADPH:quinone reductase-like Zn-dependent oxidoreductase
MRGRRARTVGRGGRAVARAGRDVNAWLASGAAVHPRQHVFTLDRLADAHVAVEEGAVGKVIVQIPPR